LLGGIEFLGDEPGVPSKDRVGFDETGHLLQGLLAQPLANLRRRLAFPTGKAMSLMDESLANSRELGRRPLMERVLVSRRDILKA
jgi:hypothetical protein